jgi:hypothetical protein
MMLIRRDPADIPPIARRDERQQADGRVLGRVRSARQVGSCLGQAGSLGG